MVTTFVYLALILGNNFLLKKKITDLVLNTLSMKMATKITNETADIKHELDGLIHFNPCKIYTSYE